MPRTPSHPCAATKGKSLFAGTPMSANRSNSGVFFLVAVLAVGYLTVRAVVGDDAMPALRGIDLGVPFAGILIAAVILVCWAGKFFSVK
jgi:hypothetical protein